MSLKTIEEKLDILLGLARDLTLARGVSNQAPETQVPKNTLTTMLKPVGLTPAEFSEMSQAEAADTGAVGNREGIALGGGQMLTEIGGSWSVSHNGRTLAATKVGGRFLVIADDASEGAWLIAAQHSLDLILSQQ
jgi:hypothetical protein